MSGNAYFPLSQKYLHRCFLFLLCGLFLFTNKPIQAGVQISKSEPAPVTPITALEDAKGKQNPNQTVNVIASRLPSDKRKITEVPSNVSYVDKQELKLKQPLTFQDAVKDLESVTLNDSVGNGLDTEFGLRGFSGSSRIIFLVDGVRVNEVDGNVMTFPLISIKDMESIEVQRGSASPVYGSNAFAGVVNITTGQPSEKPLKMFGGFEWGSFHSINFYQGFSGTIQDKITRLGGAFKYYFNGGRYVGEGWRANDEHRLTSFDIKTAYELPDKQGRAYVNVKHNAAAISNPGEMTFQQFEDNMHQTNKMLDGRDYRNTVIQVGADKKFWDNHITASIMNSWRTNLTHFFSTSGTFTDPPFNPDTNLVTTNGWEQNLIGQVKYEDYLHENVYNESILGMEFRDQNQYSLQQDAFGGNVVETSPRETERGASAYNTAIFWRETLKFFDKVMPYFGMRHDFNWLNTDDFLSPGQSISRRWHKSTVSMGVSVTPVSFMDVFFDYSQGFRVPSISDITPFGGTISSDLQPEKSSSYETGTRLRYKDKAAYKVSLFFIDLTDEIRFDSTAIGPTAPFGQNINIGGTRRYGIEQRLDLTPIREVKLYGSYTWLNAYVTETNNTGTPFDGRSLGQIPENRFTFGTVVSPLASLGENFEGFKIGLRGIYTGPQHAQSYESASQALLNATGGAGHTIKGYDVWDLMISYEWREKMIYFKVNNVFDEKYYSRAVNATSFGTAIYPSGTFTFVNPGDPREFVIGMKWAFE